MYFITEYPLKINYCHIQFKQQKNSYHLGTTDNFMHFDIIILYVDCW